MSARSVLRELRLRQFRNFAELEQSFPAEGVALIGENGAGKTNLLEAIYYLEIFRSFRGAPDDQLVRFGAEAFHLRGRFGTDTGTQGEVTAAFEAKSRKKKVTRNGIEPDRMADAIGGPGAVIFSPSDVGIVRGSPAERRRFLDIVLSLNRPGYVNELQRYRQVLRHRNAALRDVRAASSLPAWDEALVQAGVLISAARAEWVLDNGAAFCRRYEVIAHGTQASMKYESVLARRHGADTLFDGIRLAAAFRSELERQAARERERGVTLVGPHRDDLIFSIRGATADIDLRSYGSGGQVRTAAIALRMVEADTVRLRRARNPLILLDDVFAELDRPRSIRILELLETEQPGQVVLTAPKESDVQVRQGRLAQWRITQGQISA